MKSFNLIAAASCLGILTFVPNASADQWNKKTYITVAEAVQVPGKVLQPGRYVMRLVDSPSNRHIVQIYNEREDQLQTTVLAIPNYRLRPTGKTEFQWWETPAGQPKAIRAWFYPGDNFGQEFAYPKTEAVKIATVTNQQVPATYAQTEAELTTARVGTVDRAGTEMELDRKTYTSPKTTEVAQNRTTPKATESNMPAATQRATGTDTMPPATQRATTRSTPVEAAATETAARRRTLPRTATSLPLIALIGFMALGASVAVRAIGSRA